MITVKEWRKEKVSNWVFDQNSSESYIHVCEGKTLKKMQEKNIEIRKHDVTTFAFVYDEKGKFNIEYFKFCPFCGCDLDQE